MTGENKEKTEPWIEAKGAKYGYAYDKGLKLFSELGFRGFPSAALVDPTGNIVWSGHPASLDAKTIEPFLEGSLAMPLWEWPESADKSVRKQLMKMKLDKALAAAQEIGADADGAKVVELVQSFVKGRVDAVMAMKERGDFLRAYDAAQTLKKQLGGLTESDQIGAVVKEIKADKAAQAVIKAQKKIAKLRFEAGELRKKDDAEDLMEDLQKIRREHSGTYADTEAQELIDSIRKRVPHLR